jgi:hypothetical protein
VKCLYDAFLDRVYIVGGDVLVNDAMGTVELYAPTTRGTVLPYPYDYSDVAIS